ncbi:CLUMA_CG007745, isoform A [Clunio marinus]|uniref:CLUMA_CG007745, isoform A n=1 Tax=Clunio marinus TaxID=568069 RepID=A0A1J1I5M2_9DIPT|nr:CLUMA_CG007745, isoform A [Clunio marinus]
MERKYYRHNWKIQRFFPSEICEDDKGSEFNFLSLHSQTLPFQNQVIKTSETATHHARYIYNEENFTKSFHVKSFSM